MSDIQSVDDDSIAPPIADSGPNPRNGRVWVRLVEDGPSSLWTGFSRTSLTLAERREGVSSFTITTSAGGSLSGSGKFATVYYLRDRHEPAAVVEAWVDENADRIANVTPWSVHQRISRNYSDEHAEASRALLGPFRAVGGNNGGNETTDVDSCGVCGETIGDHEYLPKHLEECPGEWDADRPNPGHTSSESWKSGGKNGRTDCPLCGKRIGGTPLASHLPKCPKRDEAGEVERL